MACRYRTAGAAIEMLLLTEDRDRLASLLTETGDAVLASGQVATVLGGCRAIPARLRTAAIDELEGEARQIQGDWPGAITCFERAARGFEVLPARLAWKTGLIHYLRGDLNAALAVYQRGLEDSESDPAQMALLLAWTATAHWLRGEVADCRVVATRAFDAATASGNSRALAAAHTSLAMLAALDGDRRANDAHYLWALRAAEEASDVLQIIRIRTNRASHFTEEGAYGAALNELDVAIPLAETSSFVSFLGLSLNNRGEVRL